MTFPSTFYAVHFIWTDPRHFNRTIGPDTAEHQVATDMADVFEQIELYGEEDPSRIQVIHVDAAENDARDVTEDALLAYARRSYEISEEWPWWLLDMAPADILADHERRQWRSTDHAAE